VSSLDSARRPWSPGVSPAPGRPPVSDPAAPNPAGPSRARSPRWAGRERFGHGLVVCRPRRLSPSPFVALAVCRPRRHHTAGSRPAAGLPNHTHGPPAPRPIGVPHPSPEPSALRETCTGRFASPPPSLRPPGRPYPPTPPPSYPRPPHPSSTAAGLPSTTHARFG